MMTLSVSTTAIVMLPLYLLIPTSIITIIILRYLLRLLLPRPQVNDFNNKYVLITGCDSGFGKMTAKQLDQKGFRVIATCLTNEGKENIENLCSDRLVSMVLDITDSRQINDVFTKVKSLVADKGICAKCL